MPQRKRALSTAVLETVTEEPAPRSGGQGGAWRTGLRSDQSHDLDAMKQKAIDDILSGNQAIRIDPTQVIDQVGTDRRADWERQEAYKELRDSIHEYGQDTPIEVWPLDPDWRPNTEEPFVKATDRFELVTGRRRRLATEELGLLVRAIILLRKHEPDNHQWQVLIRRYRENNHRANLSPFEKMLSVAEMYDAWYETVDNGSIRQFGKVIGLDATYVSRSTRLGRHEAKLRETVSDPYALSYREIERWLTRLTKKPAKKAAASPSKVKLTFGDRQVQWQQTGRKVTLVIPDVPARLDPDEMCDAIQALIDDMSGDGR